MLRSRIDTAVRNQSTSKTSKSFELIGCTGKELFDYLTDMGYNADTDHIDHIVPCAKFDLTQETHQRVCFNWRNLQPLLAEDNLSKHDTLVHNWQDIVIGISESLDIDPKPIIEYINNTQK